METYKTSNEDPDYGYQQLYAMKLVRTPHLVRKLAWWGGGIFLLVFLSLFLPWTQNVSSRGTLTTLNPGDRPQTVQATIAGRIESWHVQEGQKIKKGDTIVRLSEIKEKFFDPKLLSRMNDQILSKSNAINSSRLKAQALQKQIRALSDGLNYSLNKAKNKINQSLLKLRSDSMDFVAAKLENQISKDQFQRQEALYKQGLKSLTELEQRKLKLQESNAKILSGENKYNASISELSNSRIELFSLEAEYLDKIAKAESELNSTLSYIYNSEAEVSKMLNEYSNVEIRNGFYFITSPCDGYAVKAQKQGLGETLKEGEPVITIMPIVSSLAAELYIKPMDVPLLQKGSKVRLQFDGWPALVFSGWPGTGFGTFAGEVAVIDNIDTEGKYRILVVPDKNHEPWPSALRVGTGALGWAMLKDVPIYYEMWRQMNGFPPEYTGEVFESKIHKDKDLEKKYE